MSRRSIRILIFVVGLALGLLGYLTDLYSAGIATLLMLGVWLFGSAAVSWWFGRSRRRAHKAANITTDPHFSAYDENAWKGGPQGP